MLLTRRVLLAALAAVLATARIPGAIAREVAALPDVDFDDDDGPFIEYLEIGGHKEMLGGPATEPGWYLHPVCMTGCCKSEGPFSTRKAALVADRIHAAEINIGLRKQRMEGRVTEESLYF